jgi:hypothetical protein
MSTRSDRIPLIFIHGAWLSAVSWENYLDYFGKRGFDASALEWPRKHGDVEEIRETGWLRSRGGRSRRVRGSSRVRGPRPIRSYRRGA